MENAPRKHFGMVGYKHYSCGDSFAANVDGDRWIATPAVGARAPIQCADSVVHRGAVRLLR